MVVKNYAPELLELFRIASQQEVIIPLDSEAKARRLRFRMHNLRKEMRKEQHPLLPLAELSQLTVQRVQDLGGGNERWQLIVTPADGDFVGALRDAGIKIKLEGGGIQTQSEPPSTADAQNVASAVSKFMQNKD